MNLKQKAGKKLKLLRIRNDLDQQGLASKIGCSQQTISAWENGNTEIPYDRIEQICETFNVKPTYFFKDDLQKKGGLKR